MTPRGLPVAPPIAGRVADQLVNREENAYDDVDLGAYRYRGTTRLDRRHLEGTRIPGSTLNRTVPCRGREIATDQK